MNYMTTLYDPEQGGYIAALTFNVMFLEGWGATVEEAKEDLSSTAQEAGLITWLYSNDEGFPELRGA